MNILLHIKQYLNSQKCIYKHVDTNMSARLWAGSCYPGFHITHPAVMKLEGFPIDDIMTRTRTSCSNISQELHLARHFGFRKLLQYFSCNPHHLDTAEPHAAETFPNPDLISMTIVPQLRAAIRIVEITPCSNNH